MKSLSSKDIPLLIAIIIGVIITDIWHLTQFLYKFTKPYAIAASLVRDAGVLLGFLADWLVPEVVSVQYFIE